MQQSNNQQNETNPTGGRDLGQITLQTITIQELIEIARVAKNCSDEDLQHWDRTEENPPNIHTREERNAYTASSICWQLRCLIAERCGPSTADMFADAAGFDIEE